MRVGSTFEFAGPRVSAMTHPITVLLVEDNPGDARLVIEALKEGNVLSRLKIVRDGVEAMMYLPQRSGVPVG